MLKTLREIVLVSTISIVCIFSLGTGVYAQILYSNENEITKPQNEVNNIFDIPKEEISYYKMEEVTLDESEKEVLNKLLHDVNVGTALTSIDNVEQKFSDNDMITFAILYIQANYNNSTEYIIEYEEKWYNETNIQEKYKYVVASKIVEVVYKFFGKENIEYKLVNSEKYHSTVDAFEPFRNVSVNLVYKFNRLMRLENGSYYLYFESNDGTGRLELKRQGNRYIIVNMKLHKVLDVIKTDNNKTIVYGDIPTINIKNIIADKINTEIQSIYTSSVEYSYYLNKDVLSILIDNTKTYNYNIRENRLISLKELLEGKGISLDEAQKVIWDKKDKNNPMYEIGRVENYYKDENGYIVVVYSKEDVIRY